MARQYNFDKMMNEQGDFIQIDKSWQGKGMIPKGALIGFKAFGDERGITAAYPFWREIGNQIQFVLFMPGECDWTDVAVMDNGYFDGECFINREPIIIEVNDKRFMTFGGALGEMFGEQATIHTNQS